MFLLFFEGPYSNLNTSSSHSLSSKRCLIHIVSSLSRSKIRSLIPATIFILPTEKVRQFESVKDSARHNQSCYVLFHTLFIGFIFCPKSQHYFSMMQSYNAAMPNGICGTLHSDQWTARKSSDIFSFAENMAYLRSSLGAALCPQYLVAS